jgi:hypothetical protein
MWIPQVRNAGLEVVFEAADRGWQLGCVFRTDAVGEIAARSLVLPGSVTCLLCAKALCAISSDRSFSLHQIADTQHDLRDYDDGEHDAQRHDQ